MLRKAFILCVSLMVIVFCSCDRKSTSGSEDYCTDSLSNDTSSVVEEDEDESILDAMPTSPHLDEVFGDFLFTFVNSHALQRQRIEFPLKKISVDGVETRIDRKNWNEDFSFLKGDYYTSIFTKPSEFSYSNDSTIRNVRVECIFLNERRTKCFDFEKNEGKWMLKEIKEINFEDDDLDDFLSFYSKWSKDSVFRDESISKNLKISILDPDDEDQNIDGFIDKEQFVSFCPDVPKDTITNVIYGQNYINVSWIILLKSGLSNGMQELFTFERDHKGWKLKKYEN